MSVFQWYDSADYEDLLKGIEDYEAYDEVHTAYNFARAELPKAQDPFEIVKGYQRVLDRVAGKVQGCGGAIQYAHTHGLGQLRSAAGQFNQALRHREQGLRILGI